MKETLKAIGYVVLTILGAVTIVLAFLMAGAFYG